MAKLTLKMSRPKLRGWPFVVIVGLVLATLAVIDSGEFTLSECQLVVTTTQANVLAKANVKAAVVETHQKGDKLDGTKVVTAGFRQLAENRWISVDDVTPASTTTCR